MIRVLLVRHGESEWNAAGRWQGQADPPLTATGRRQGRSAAASIGALDTIVASDLQRARETAEIIAEELGVGPVELDAGFRERHAGAWQGLTRSEIHEQWPGYLPDDPVHGGTPPPGVRRPPGYEDDAAVIERALQALDRLANRVGEGDALVVTHGGVIHAIERHLGVTEWDRIANLAARWVVIGDGRLGLGERVILVDPEQATEQPADQV